MCGLTLSVTIVCVNSCSYKTLNSCEILCNACHMQQTQAIIEYMINTYTADNHFRLSKSMILTTLCRPETVIIFHGFLISK